MVNNIVTSRDSYLLIPEVQYLYTLLEEGTKYVLNFTSLTEEN